MLKKMFAFDFSRVPAYDGESPPDRTRLLLGLTAAAVALTLGLYGAARLAGTDPAGARIFAQAVDGALFAAAFIASVATRRRILPVLCLAAAASVFTGTSFTICQAAFDGTALLVGAGAMMAAVLTALFKNIDEHASFMALVMSMLGALLVLLFSLS